MRRAWLVALVVSVLVHAAGVALLVGLASLLGAPAPRVVDVPVAPAKHGLMKVGLMAREPKGALPSPLGASGPGEGQGEGSTPRGGHEEGTTPGADQGKGTTPGDDQREQPPPGDGQREVTPGDAQAEATTPGDVQGEATSGGGQGASTPGDYGEAHPAGRQVGEQSGSSTTAPTSTLVAAMHARLAASAERCYPAAARRFHQQGVVEVSFCVGTSGAVAKLALGGTTGSTLLDRAARECVVPNAAPFPELAAGECFSVPVRFGQR